VSRTIVLLHGWGYQPSLWQALKNELKGQHVLTPSLAPDSPDIEAWSDALANEFPVGSVFVGWSLGAMLALSIATRHPDLVAGMLLIGATPCFANKEDWQHGLDPDVVAQFESDFARNPQRTLKRFLTLQTLGDEARSALVSFLEPSLVTHLDAGSRLKNGLCMLATTDLRGKLPSTGLPCTLLHGENDALMPVMAARHLHSNLPGSRLIVRGNAGHAPLFNDMSSLAELIQGICNDCA